MTYAHKMIAGLRHPWATAPPPAYLATVGSAGVSDTGLAASTTYAYTVSAIDAAGNESAQTGSVNATTAAGPAADTTAPTAPAAPSATAISDTQINVSWTPSTDAVGVQGYKVYRGGTYLTTVGSAGFSDTGLTASTNYAYTVSAIDAAGNESAPTGSVNATTSAGGSLIDSDFSYNTYGDMTQSANSASVVTTYTYDSASRLTSIDNGGAATDHDAAFTFDALGRNRTRTVAGATVGYGYLGSSEVVFEIVDGTASRRSVFAADGSRVATSGGTNFATTTFLLPDLHGNVAASESAGTTTVANAIRYDGYGQTAAAYAGTGSIALDFKYQGRLDVSPTADPLYDLTARYYDPGLGAFTSMDSVMGSAQNPASMNRFLYALANPTTFIDPTGHRPVEDSGTSKCTYLNDPGCTSAAPPATSVSSWSIAAPRVTPRPYCPLASCSTRSTTTTSHPDNESDGRSVTTVTVPTSSTWVPTGMSWTGERNPGWSVTASISSGCSIDLLRCSVDDFNIMTASERIGWIRAIDRAYGKTYNFNGWFSNVIGFIKGADDQGWIKPGTSGSSGNWMSWTDAGILQGVQDGLALRTSAITASANPGAPLWSDFFDYRFGDPSNQHVDEAMTKWGTAEQTSTDYGQDVAFGKGKLPSAQQWLTGIASGNVYRAMVANPGPTRAIGFAGGGLGGAAAGASVCGPVCAGGGGVGGATLGEGLAGTIIDPRQELPARVLVTSLGRLYANIPFATWEP